jgi:hypothetical protein
LIDSLVCVCVSEDDIVLGFLCSLPCVYGEQTYGFSTAKVRELGMKFRDVEEMFDDAVDSLRAHGYLLNSVP